MNTALTATSNTSKLERESARKKVTEIVRKFTGYASASCVRVNTLCVSQAVSTVRTAIVNARANGNVQR